jgi:hypothetical protein
MNIAEIFGNFVSTYVILIIVLVIYLIFILAHPYSKSIKNAIKPYVTGAAIEAGLWLIFTIVAVFLSTQNAKLAVVFEHVLGTNVLSVGLITLSLFIVSITFSMHEASNHNYKYDYRAVAICIFFGIAVAFGIIYWIITPPM